MKRIFLVLAVVLACSSLVAKQAPVRPRILGIARIKIYSSDLPAAHAFYGQALDQSHDCNWCETLPNRDFLLSNLQRIVLTPMPSPAPVDLLEEVTFATDDVPALRRYLAANKIRVGQTERDPDSYLRVTDPEGHNIGFVGGSGLTDDMLLRFKKSIPYEPHIIHAGFVVRDRPATDHFYKDILGFRPYWHGGMKDDETSWVAMQVPEGTDWVEYMLNIPSTADHHTLGVMNHIALGVTDIQAAKAQLRKNGWKPGEEPKLGRDGKWQLNLYDPDDTRVEFMEFTPKEKPCCSEFTGPHPGSKQ
jgi:catechol 2,3-dioxygenase-like lactoylglutathione lyase family enzyme